MHAVPPATGISIKLTGLPVLALFLFVVFGITSFFNGIYGLFWSDSLYWFSVALFFTLLVFLSYTFFKNELIARTIKLLCLKYPNSICGWKKNST